MVTKGFDFPDVTLVGVVLADTSLDFPDCRAKEKTFQLLPQVAGRAGRGKLGGEVILQTYYPEVWAITLAAQQDFLGFYKKEMMERKELFYPPFSRMVLIRFQGKDERKLHKITTDFREELSLGLKSSQVLGPTPAPIYKMKDNYRFQILIKIKNIEIVTKKIDSIIEKYKNKILPGVRISVEVDPLEIM